MKNIILIFIVVISSTVSRAQSARIIFSIAANKNLAFEDNAYVNLGLGTEIKINDFFKPDFEIGYLNGGLYGDILFDDESRINGISQFTVQAVHFSATPKFTIYESKKNIVNINLLPKYSYSAIWSEVLYAALTFDGFTTGETETQNGSDTQNSYGIGVGVCFNFGQKDSDSIALNLYFNRVELGGATNNLSRIPRTLVTRNDVGFGFVYYFAFKNRIEKGF